VTDPLVKWSGSFADESGWKRELYEYLASTDIDKIALGKMPISLQLQLQKVRATEPPDANAITTLATLLIACQQIHGHKSEGVVGEGAIAAIYAAYLTDATMTTTGKSHEHHGGTLAISIAPSSDEPFMLATFLARYVREGFPDKFASDPSLDTNVRFEERIAVIREPQMIGSYVKSPSKRFAVVWSDSNDGSEAGERTSGWILLDGERILNRGSTRGRISNGAVSDVGRFLIAIGRSHGEVWQTEITGIEWTGKDFFSKRFDAYATAVAISETGALGAAHFAASWKGRNAPDSLALVLFDLVQNVERWRRPVLNNPRRIAVRESQGFVHFELGDGALCSFHLDGRTALDDPAYVRDLQGSGSSPAMALMGWARLGEAGKLTADDPGLAVLREAVATSSDPYFKASTLRDLGEAAEQAGLRELTVEFWREAVRLSPRVGVKKRLTELERELGMAAVAPAVAKAIATGALKVVAHYPKLRADGLAILPGSVLVAGYAKGQTTISEVHVDGAQRQICGLPGTGPRMYTVSSGLLVLTDEGRVGEGRGWSSLVSPSGLIAQNAYGDKITEGADAGGLLAVGCRDGYLYGLEPSELGQLWKFKVPGSGDGMTIPHPYHVTAGGGVIWISYTGTIWCVSAGEGRLLMHRDVDWPTALAALPDGSLAMTIYKGLAIVKKDGSAKLTELTEPNGKIYGVDRARGRVIIGRWGQGDWWHLLDFDGRVVHEAKLGGCDGAEVGPSGRIAIWKDDTVTVADHSLTVIGSIEQPKVTGNRVRDVAWDADGASIWVSGKGVLKVAVYER
jgi:hypothetical protein